MPKFRDGLSFLYVEHAVIHKEVNYIIILQKEGTTTVPAAALGVLILGPGTSITHAAIRVLAENGCSVLWVGEDCGRFYGSGLGETRSSSRLLQQARAWANPKEHEQVVLRLYKFRFQEPFSTHFSLKQIRGLEGVRVRDTYARWSKETGVPWSGRKYVRGRWGITDPVNRAISVATSILYGVCHAGIVSTGYSTALGFIHTGKMLSFVYDIADLYKTEVVIPAAFITVAESNIRIEQRVRKAVRERIREARILEKVVTDLQRLFDGLGGACGGCEDPYAEDDAKPGKLWNVDGLVNGGVNYGVNDFRESTEEFTG
ncbi:MAG: type I-E CRISPR-associated endonuclease Cas1 [Dehalococcoidales bacterium]|nr:type I-E CRISPR-associated endonuclease Cas1 [Dehalococcoidales bacterium]